MEYRGKNANLIYKYVVAHCNGERILSGIDNDSKEILKGKGDYHGILF